jgi:hypothetical protein
MRTFIIHPFNVDDSSPQYETNFLKCYKTDLNLIILCNNYKNKLLSNVRFISLGVKFEYYSNLMHELRGLTL